jgi:hypothetical protein
MFNQLQYVFVAYSVYLPCDNASTFLPHKENCQNRYSWLVARSVREKSLFWHQVWCDRVATLVDPEMAYTLQPIDIMRAEPDRYHYEDLFAEADD